MANTALPLSSLAVTGDAVRYYVGPRLSMISTVRVIKWNSAAIIQPII